MNCQTIMITKKIMSLKKTLILTFAATIIGILPLNANAEPVQAVIKNNIFS